MGVFFVTDGTIGVFVVVGAMGVFFVTDPTVDPSVLLEVTDIPVPLETGGSLSLNFSRLPRPCCQPNRAQSKTNWEKELYYLYYSRKQ